MKTILVPTDFSVSAQNAAYYALHMARDLSADMMLCHAFTVPAQVADQPLDWPLYEYETMQASTVKQLELFAGKLKAELKNDPEGKGAFLPALSCASEVGALSDLIHKLVKDTQQNMVVMGMTGMSAVVRFFLGSVSQQLINHAQVPVLLIPPHTKFVPIKRIAFATDFSDQDVAVIRSLTVLAAKYDADLVITHVKDEWEDERQMLQKEHLLLDRLITKINYSKFYMRRIASTDIDEGLEILSSEYKINVVVMVHKKASFLHRILVGSHSQALAKRIHIPLMVIPENLQPIF